MQTSLRRLLQLEAGEVPASAQEKADFRLYLDRLAADPGRLPANWLEIDATDAWASSLVPITSDQLPPPSGLERTGAGRELVEPASPSPGGSVRSGRLWRLVAAGAVAATAISVVVAAIFASNASTARAELAQSAVREKEERETALAAKATADREAAIARHEQQLKEDARRERDAATAAVGLLIAQTEILGRFQTSDAEGRRILDQVRGHLSVLAAGAEQDPARVGEAADLYRRCGKLAFNLGDVPRAASDYDTARRLAERAFDAEDIPTNRHRLAMVLREWGVTRAKQWKVAEALPAWDRAFQLLEPLAPADPERRFILAQLFMVRGNVGATPEERQRQFGEAERLIEGLLREKPGNPNYLFTLAEILNNRTYLVGGDAKEQASHNRRAVEIRRQLVKEKPDDKQLGYLAASLNHLGLALEKLGSDRFAEAEDVYSESRDLYKALKLAFPGVASNRDELNQVEKNLQRLAAKRDTIAPPPRPR